ncbi:MAG: shikimate kinase [Flavobacteriales bacterium]|nr:shikimate kinase [Flavobacteriales bacterium]
MKLPIILIGFMASGKSSLGKKLARKLNLRFTDLDTEIEKREGISITEIFKNKGEAYFRALETEILQEVLQNKDHVIALGGGAVCHSNNIDLVNGFGLSIYLKKSNAQLLGRLRQNKEERPLVADLNDVELKSLIQEKMNERAVFYEQAHLIIEEDKPKISDLLERIQQLEVEK